MTHVIQSSGVLSTDVLVVHPRSQKIYHKRTPNDHVVEDCPIRSVDHDLRMRKMTVVDAGKLEMGTRVTEEAKKTHARTCIVTATTSIVATTLLTIV